MARRHARRARGRRTAGRGGRAHPLAPLARSGAARPGSDLSSRGRWKTRMARYGQKFKDAGVACLLPPESPSLEAVSQKVGISVATLERWRAAALAGSDGDGSPRQWTPAARLEAVIATAVMDEAARSAWCREHGLYPT